MRLFLLVSTLLAELLPKRQVVDELWCPLKLASLNKKKTPATSTSSSPTWRRKVSSNPLESPKEKYFPTLKGLT